MPGYTGAFGSVRRLTPGIGAALSAALVSEGLPLRYVSVGTGEGVFLTLRVPVHEMVP